MISRSSGRLLAMDVTFNANRLHTTPSPLHNAWGPLRLVNTGFGAHTLHFNPPGDDEDRDFFCDALAADSGFVDEMEADLLVQYLSEILEMDGGSESDQNESEGDVVDKVAMYDDDGDGGEEMRVPAQVTPHEEVLKPPGLLEGHDHNICEESIGRRIGEMTCVLMSVPHMHCVCQHRGLTVSRNSVRANSCRQRIFEHFLSVPCLILR